jgi:tRNA A37 threonylcarbamoyladenosine synthetase subunit TsaC/SUA5/YrdC
MSWTDGSDEDLPEEYRTDPELIHESYGHLVNLVIDGGPGDLTPSTVVNCLETPFEIVREGKGELEF